MFLLLLLLFIAVPVIEVWLILEVAQLLGGGSRGLGLTLVVLVVDSLIGALLVRHHGRSAWSELRGAINAGRIPGNEAVNGGFVLIGATFLLLPGFLSDFAGVLFLIPVTRKPMAGWMFSFLRRRITVFPTNADSGMRDFAYSDQPRRRPESGPANSSSAGETDLDLEKQHLSE
ncbi:MAG: FxsA family protein [Solirubrobacterales bacterium]